MKKRILAAAVLVPVLLIVLYALPKVVAAVVVSLICGIGAYELLYRTGLVKHLRLVIYSVVFAAAVPLVDFFGLGALWTRFGVLAFFGLMFMEMMLSHTKLRLEKVALCFFGALVVPSLLSAMLPNLAPEGGRYLILIPCVLAFLSDTGAYFIGCRFGKHKLAPVISPNKSVEGLIGGLGFAVVGMLLYCVVMQLIFKCQVHYGYALVYGVFGSLAGVFGDLCFSVIKRQTGIKDYGNLIPGHGGVLDRFDSLLVVAPLVELMLSVFPVVVPNG